MIELRNIKLHFGPLSVLDDISFSISKGEKVSLMGPGGSGKSSILKVLLGLLEPDEGQVHILETDMRTASDHERVHILRRVGMAFQQGALFDFMTVRENLVFAMENMTEKSVEQMEDTVTFLLDGVKLGRTAGMYPHELSGGMQRRVGIARALCTDPVIAIFDEPTAGLDPVTSTIILNMISELTAQDDQHCQMVVTSNVEIGIRFADRVVLVNDGTVVADGPWRELLLDGSDWVKHFLGIRFIGLDRDYAEELHLPKEFIAKHWD